MLFDKLAKSPDKSLINTIIHASKIYIISVRMKSTVSIQAMKCATNGGATPRSLDNRGYVLGYSPRQDLSQHCENFQFTRNHFNLPVMQRKISYTRVIIIIIINWECTNKCPRYAFNVDIHGETIPSKMYCTSVKQNILTVLI